MPKRRDNTVSPLEQTEPDSSTLDLSELEAHTKLVSNIHKFHGSFARVSAMVDTLCDSGIYEKLDAEGRVKYDLFMSYALNSLFWMYLRTKGRNPAQTPVKSEINRVKEYFDKYQKIKDRKTIMPRVNQDVAKRFVRSGLWEPKDKKRRE
uniref:Nuclear nucleic acid-binding protein C1D n=1 Tax=Timema californicum TaxID=61474 RepID=A0A7R9JHD3_TIMCA|nr:unnamed protein product [Timema californicum]